MAARKKKVTLSENWKDGIRASNVMRRLYDHCNGDIEMSMSQINAAKIILSKIVPDLARTEVANAEDKAFQTVNRVQFEIVNPQT